MGRYLKQLIYAGSWSKDSDVVLRLADVPWKYYRKLYFNRLYSLAFVADVEFPILLRVVRALSVAERYRLCPYPGSVSLLISVYIHSHKRIDGERAALADWIVSNHDNPYTPFNFQSTRDKWEWVRQSSRSPLETLYLVEALEEEGERRASIRAQRHQVHTAISLLPKGIAPSSQDLRERMLEEMEREILM